MKRIATLFIALLTTAGVLAQPAAAPLSIKAQAEPAVALPGIPVHLVLTVENASAVPQRLPSLLTIEARPQSGEPFLPNARPETPVHPWPDEYRNALTIEPGQTRVYHLPLASELTARAMGDPRIWNPGAYALRVLLHDQLRNEDVTRFGVHGLLGAGRIESPLLASTDATLRVDQPSGLDAEIWSAILAKTEGRGLAMSTEDHSDAVARELWTRGSDSAYGPYLVYYIRKVAPEERQKIWAHVIKRDPGHPIAQTIRIAAARRKALEARWSIARGASLETVLSETDDARKTLNELSKEVKNDLLRIAARNALAEMKSREELAEMHRDLAPRK